MHAQQRFRVQVTEFERPLIGVVKRRADPARKMGVGGGDHHMITMFLDRHDPLQRVLRLDIFGSIACQCEDLVMMLPRKGAIDTDESGGKTIPDTMARRTQFVFG